MLLIELFEQGFFPGGEAKPFACQRRAHGGTAAADLRDFLRAEASWSEHQAILSVRQCST
jgi:hypothetical protein